LSTQEKKEKSPEMARAEGARIGWDMVVGGELAALFARRMDGDPLAHPPPAAAAKSELAMALERRAGGAPPQVPRNHVPGFFSNSIPLSPDSTRPPLATPPRTPSSPAAFDAKTVPTALVEEPVRIASIAENEEVKAIFDERNLEAGIPTPAFLLNVRANLKKPGSTPAPKSIVHPLAGSANITNGKSSNSDAVSVSSDTSAPVDRSKSEVGQLASQLALNARRRRMVAARSSASSVTSAVSDQKNLSIVTDVNNIDVNKVAVTSPTMTTSPRTAMSEKARRGKLLSKVRASQIAANNTSSKPQLHAPDGFKTQIHSPKSDEYEVLFANYDFGDNDDINSQTLVPMDESPMIPQQKHKSLITIADGSNSTVGSGTRSTLTVPTNNESRSINSSNLVYDDKKNATPEKSTMKIHNASTPKTRGSLRREIYQSPGKNSTKQRLPSMQEQQHMETDDSLVEPPQLSSTPHSFPVYPMRQSPSQLSQMSGITTPSCFPQDLLAQSGGSGGTSFIQLQQPMLIGGPIPESCSRSSSVDEVVMNVGGDDIVGSGPGNRISAFSSIVDTENRRLREQLGKLTQRLDEKDAIISQLMKRIGDLELMSYSAARGTALAYQSNSTTINQSPCGGAQSYSSSGQLSVPATSVTARMARSTSTLETESANLSTSKPAVESIDLEPSHPHTNHHQRGNKISKSSPFTTHTSHTSSTASVTTTGSSRSKNSRRSRDHRRSLSVASDERKFVC
jgi:hypothetical protein